MTISVLDEVYLRTEEYQKVFSKKDRKDKAQFFTSKQSAIKMADYLVCNQNEVVILEPGAGNGALTIAVVLKLISKGCKNISCILIENDQNVIPLLTENIQQIEKFSKDNNINFSAKIETSNFLLMDNIPSADIAIMNPPYKKIRKDSQEASKMKEFVFGQPNLYSLFMGKTIQHLKENGEFVFIVPRSWTSGEYFKNTRQYILNNTNIKNICIFNDRDKAFSSENVLQETMIFSGYKNTTQSKNIKIDVYNDDTFSQKESFTILSNTIKNIGTNNYLLIPSKNKEVEILSKFSKSNKTFIDMGYEFKTGPVVEFRNKNEISVSQKNNYVPMFRTANIINGKLLFPIKQNKPQYVSVSADKLLLDNKNTIFVRRLSSKEEQRRIQCCIYKALNGQKYISVENHVNYLTKKDKTKISNKELTDIYNLLMSEEYDLYFRLLNGSTQVNAKELNNLPYIEDVLI